MPKPKQSPPQESEPWYKGLPTHLFLAVTAAAILVVWNGTLTAVQIKGLIAQTGILAVLIGFAVANITSPVIKIRRSPVPPALAIWALVMVVSYLRTPGSSLNLRPFLVQISGVGVFAAALLVIRRERLPKLMNVIVFCGLTTSAYGIIQKLNIDPIEWLNPSVISLFGNKNYFAAFLILSLPLTLYASTSLGDPLMAWVSRITSGMMVAALFLTESRSGLLGLAVIILSIVLLVIAKGRTLFANPKTRWILLALPIVATVLSVALMPPRFKRRFTDMGTSRPVQIRKRSYKAALEVVRQNPVAGNGPGSYLIKYPANRANRIFEEDPNTVVKHVHNEFLEILVEHGLVGLIAFLLILGATFHSWLLQFRFCRDRRQLFYLIGLFCSIAGFLTMSQLSVASRYTSSVVPFWLVLAMVWVTDPRDFSEITLKNPFASNQSAIKVSRALLVLIGVVMGAILLMHFRSDVKMKRGFDLSNARFFDASLPELEAAVSLWPKSVEAMYQRAYAHFQKGDYDKAIADYDLVHKWAPAYTNVNFNLAASYFRKKDYRAALKPLLVSYDLYPQYPRNLLMLASCYYYIRQPEKGLKYANRMVELYPKDKDGLRLKAMIEEVLAAKPPGWPESR